MKVRSMVGLIPLFAVETLEPRLLDQFPGFKRRLEWFVANRRDLTQNVASMVVPGRGERRLLSMVSPAQLSRILKPMLDENEFLSPFGIRSVSRFHKDHPYVLASDGQEHRVDYEPGASHTGLFGGNSNWRGPVWFPLNYLLIESLQKFHHYLGDEYRVECPTGSGHMMNLWEVAAEISRRLSPPVSERRQRPAAGERRQRMLPSDPHWRDLVLFYEYFHGDTGQGLGAKPSDGVDGIGGEVVAAERGVNLRAAALTPFPQRQGFVQGVFLRPVSAVLYGLPHKGLLVVCELHFHIQNPSPSTIPDMVGAVTNYQVSSGFRVRSAHRDGAGFAFRIHRDSGLERPVSNNQPPSGGDRVSLNRQVPVLFRRNSGAQPLLSGLWRGAGIGIRGAHRRMAPPSTSTPSSYSEEGRFPAGTVLARRYRIIGLIGQGGMGEVYRASDLKLGQPVALKFLPAATAKNPQLVARFHAEVRIARQVSHPNVCRVYDIGEVDGSTFLSMEYVDSEDLRSLLRRIGRLPGDKALEIARKLCAGLAAAYDKGVLHRDLKPANIMIDGRGQVLITDFGLGRAGRATRGSARPRRDARLYGPGATRRQGSFGPQRCLRPGAGAA
jgi:hypothetical protein